MYQLGIKLRKPPYRRPCMRKSRLSAPDPPHVMLGREQEGHRELFRWVQMQGHLLSAGEKMGESFVVHFRAIATSQLSDDR